MLQTLKNKAKKDFRVVHENIIVCYNPEIKEYNFILITGITTTAITEEKAKEILGD